MIGQKLRIGRPMATGLLCLTALGSNAAFALTQPAPYTTPGTYSYTVPPDVSTISVSVAGGGGGGGGYDISGNTTGGTGGTGGPGALLSGGPAGGGQHA